jgi:hypothetical protein
VCGVGGESTKNNKPREKSPVIVLYSKKGSRVSNWFWVKEGWGFRIEIEYWYCKTNRGQNRERAYMECWCTIEQPLRWYILAVDNLAMKRRAAARRFQAKHARYTTHLEDYKQHNENTMNYEVDDGIIVD